MKSFKTTWKHIRRTPYQTIAAIITMFLTLLLAGIFALTSLASVTILEYFESKPQIIVYFTEKGGQEEANTLISKLQSTGKVLSTKYISKDDALALYKEQNKNDPLLLEMVTADILPASLEVMPKSPELLAELEPFIKESDFVEEVVYQKDVVDSLLTWTRGIRVVLGVLVCLLALDAILIILTVTSMKIALRREEIEILRLVGASRWYIRSPFILEGGLYGMVGAILAWATITGVLIWLRTTIITFFGVVPVIAQIFSDPMGSIFLLLSGGFLIVLAGVGFFIGAVGSTMAVNRFLKM